MKNKVTIKSAQGTYLQHVIFEDQSAQEVWLQMLHDTHAWGKPEHTVEVSPKKIIEHEAVKAKKEVLDKDGNVLEVAVKAQKAYTEIIEAVYKTVPSEYIVEIEDISQAIEAEKIKKESKTLERSARVNGLKSIDFAKIKTIADVNAVLKMLVKESIRDEE